MKKIAKMIPRNSSSVSVRQTGRFSLAFQDQIGVHPLADQAAVPQALQRRHHQVQHKRDADTDQQRRKQVQQTAQHTADPLQVVQPPVQQCRKGDQQHDPLDIFLIQVQSHPALRSCYTIYYHVLRKVSMQKAAQSGKFL